MIVLDTHAWVWANDAPERLSNAARRAIDAANELLVSTMTAWEFGMLVERGRLRSDRPLDEWIDDAMESSRARLVDVDLEIAVTAAGLMDAPFDPADAMIAATALAFDAPVVSADRKLAEIPELQVIW